MSQRWEVVGGTDTGGVRVREGQSLKSSFLGERLATGAIVEQLELASGRLNFKLLLGEGPSQGWASVSVNGKALLVEMPSGPAGSTGLDEVLSVEERCRRELERPPISWTWVDIPWVQEHHSSRAKGMLYGLEFPWNEEMLLEFGPAWLTRAFHIAGSLERSNAVTSITKVQKHEFGNNGGKTLLEVSYKTPSPALNPKLFAKYPFDMADKRQATDSLAQRVYKQPQDFTEVNFYRVMECYIPFKHPRFYYGDISNENTNFIMITEQVHFDDPGTKEPLAPFQIEGPYDKAMDSCLRGHPSEYYYLLARKGAMMAGLYKAGKLAPESVLDQFENTAKKSHEHYGIHPGVTGDPGFKAKLKTGETFMFEVASQIFPAEAINPGFRELWLNTMLLVNAYTGEHSFYRHTAFPDYVVFTHQNLNPDNAYFWRDAEGHLDCGVFDYGNIKAMGLGHMFYWWLYTADWEVLCEHRDGLVRCIIDTYHEYGGPRLDEARFYTMYILAALEHNGDVVKAVPLMYKMCSKKDFASVGSRTDERIFRTIDGKSTLRVYLHTWCNAVRMLLEWDAAKTLERWTEEFASPPFNLPRKDVKALYG